MTISTGSTILAADLNTLTTAQLTLMQADNAQLPMGHQVNLYFHGLTAGTVAYKAQATFIVPFDCYLETMALSCGDFTGGSTVTATVLGDGALPNFPVTIVAAPAAVSGVTKVTRVMFDATKGRVGSAYMPTNQAFRALTQGSTLTVTVSTTSVFAASALQLCLVLRSFFGRA